jgi:hypothetical protein
LPLSIKDWVLGWASQCRLVSQAIQGQTALAP